MPSVAFGAGAGAGAAAGRRLSGLRLENGEVGRSVGSPALGGRWGRELLQDEGGFCRLSFKPKQGPGVDDRYTFWCRVDECQFRAGATSVLCAKSRCWCDNAVDGTPCEDNPSISYAEILYGVNGQV